MQRAPVRIVSIVIATLLASCRPTHPTVTPAPAPAVRCPIVPVRLTLSAPGAPSSTMASLAADGSVTLGVLSENRPVATLDSHGCLVGRGDTFVEAMSNGDIWTPHERLAVVNGALRVGSGRALRIDPDGRIRAFSSAGVEESNASGGMAVEGFNETARCASQLLLATFLSAMPSMAVSDGHPRMEPVPTDSHCPHASDGGVSPPAH